MSEHDFLLGRILIFKVFDCTQSVPFFFGDDSDVYSPTLWLTNIEQLENTNGWTDNQKLSATLMSLQGPAGIGRKSESDRKPEDFQT